MNPPSFYVVATPIGNLEDVTLRALRVLKEVDFILAEHPQRIKKLLNHYDISNTVVSYHQHSKKRKREFVVQMLKKGKSFALVSDAGTPGISDPGNELISFLIEKVPQVKIIPIPGPSALTAAVSIAGFSLSKFLFLGFPPTKKKRKKFFEEIKNSKYPVVFYESRYRILRTLEDLNKVVPERKIVLCRELTKMHESVYRGEIQEVVSRLKAESLKGEFVVVIQGLKK